MADNKWKTHSEKPVVETPWFKLNLADVELPNGKHLGHYVLRQKPAALCACVNEDDEVLLLWRHRFISDSYGYELPAGAARDDEDLADAATRETLEETGYRPADLRPLLVVDPSTGLSDIRHHVYWTDKVDYVGHPADDFESDRVEWVPLAKVPDLIAAGDIRLANTVASLLMLQRMRGL